MTTEAIDRRRSARAREESAPVITEEMTFSLGRQRLGPAGDDVSGGVTEQRQETFTLYKKMSYGWKPTLVRGGAVDECIKSGSFRFECGDCGGHCGLDPNSCPGRKPLPFRRCPVAGCGKKVYDTLDVDLGGTEEEETPGEIRDEAYAASTPETRTKVKLDQHIIAFHPSEAQRLGLVTAQSQVPAPSPGPVAQGV